MSTGRDRTPLTPEERDLAQRLARLDAGAQPSAALDAGILAAARAAASGKVGSGGGGSTPKGRDTTARRSRRPRLGWAAGAGLAASVVLAIGMAWQLRPLPDTAVEYSEAPAAAPPPAASAPEAAARAIAPPKEPMPADAGARQAEAERAPAAMREAAPAPPPPPAPPPAPMRDVPPVVFDEPSPIDAPAPSVPTSEAGAASQQYDGSAPTDDSQEARRERGSLDRVEVSGSRLRRARGAASATAADADAAAEADAAAAQPWFDQPLDDAPPASADSPEVRDAWLARIRELVAEERYDEARASLAEFHHRYPDVPIPQDLRVLLPE